MTKSEYINTAIDMANKITKLSESDKKYLISILKYKEYAKGDVITDFGDVENYRHIIIDGFIRLFHIVDGKEFTLDFYKSPDLCYSIESFITRQASNYSLEACTDVITYRISHNDFSIAMNNNKNLERLGRKIAEKNYIRRINNQIDRNSLSTMDRFNKVLKDWPNILDDIPQHKIATYLGIAPESLSRIKKEIKKK